MLTNTFFINYSNKSKFGDTWTFTGSYNCELLINLGTHNVINTQPKGYK